MAEKNQKPADPIKDLKLLFFKAPWSAGYDIGFFAKGINGDREYVSQPLTMTTVSRGQYVHPTASLTQEAMQGFFDEMWKAGFRPADGTGNSGHIDALKHHLEDMRQLVFKHSVQVK